jgi:hypothetical protein
MGSCQCLHCRESFVPSPNNRQKQRYCQEADCRKASKAAAQAKWLSKEQNRRYFQGPENVERVRAWRKKNPGYWRKQSERRARPEPPQESQASDGQAVSLGRNLVTQAGGEAGTLQDFASIQVPLLVGLTSLLAGDALQDHFAVLCGQLVERGRRVLGKSTVVAATACADTTESYVHQTSH